MAKAGAVAQPAAAEPIKPDPADMEPPAADMRGKEEGETEKDIPVEERVKEDEASTAPLPDKVRPPAGRRLQVLGPGEVRPPPCTSVRHVARQVPWCSILLLPRFQ